jgi:hypothetical protein
MKICFRCNRFFSSVYAENQICRKCLLEDIKNKIISELPKHEKPKIQNLELKDSWLIPDKKT